MIKGVLHATGRIPTPDVRLPRLPASRASVDLALGLAGLRGQQEAVAERQQDRDQPVVVADVPRDVA